MAISGSKWTPRRAENTAPEAPERDARDRQTPRTSHDGRIDPQPVGGSPPTPGRYRSDMPGIGACTPLGSSPEESQGVQEFGYVTEVSYPNPQSEVELKLDQCNEFRMGCEVWYRTRIFENGRDHSERHQPLIAYLAENYPYSTTGLHPWNRSGDKLAMPTVSVLGVGFMLYDVARSRLLYTWRDPLWHGSAWSPSSEL